jgi:acyl-CoA thioesterase FadM
MSLPLRLLAVVLAAKRAAPMDLLDESSISLRVLPGDLDLNGHMNNGRYLTLMDLGRFDLVVRSGLGRAIWRRRWRPMVGSATIRFRRALLPFQRFELKTRVVCWDEKWIYLEQRFVVGGHAVAIGLVKGLFRGPEGNVAPSVVAEAVARPGLASPPMPASIRTWLAAERLAA